MQSSFTVNESLTVETSLSTGINDVHPLSSISTFEGLPNKVAYVSSTPLQEEFGLSTSKRHIQGTSPSYTEYMDYVMKTSLYQDTTFSDITSITPLISQSELKTKDLHGNNAYIHTTSTIESLYSPYVYTQSDWIKSSTSTRWLSTSQPCSNTITNCLVVNRSSSRSSYLAIPKDTIESALPLSLVNLPMSSFLIISAIHPSKGVEETMNITPVEATTINRSANVSMLNLSPRLIPGETDLEESYTIVNTIRTILSTRSSLLNQSSRLKSALSVSNFHEEDYITGSSIDLMDINSTMSFIRRMDIKDTVLSSGLMNKNSRVYSSNLTRPITTVFSKIKLSPTLSYHSYTHSTTQHSSHLQVVTKGSTYVRSVSTPLSPTIAERESSTVNNNQYYISLFNVTSSYPVTFAINTSVPTSKVIMSTTSIMKRHLHTLAASGSLLILPTRHSSVTDNTLLSPAGPPVSREYIVVLSLRIPTATNVSTTTFQSKLKERLEEIYILGWVSRRRRSVYPVVEVSVSITYLF